MRIRNRLNQTGASLLFHVDVSTWSRIEGGKREPSFQLVEQICGEWHVSADYLLFGKEDNKDQVNLNGLTFRQIQVVKSLIDSYRES